MRRLPPCYKDATLRNVTPETEGFIGLGFDLEDGTTVYLALPISDAEKLCQWIRSHSEGSSGIPSVDVSSRSNVSL